MDTQQNPLLKGTCQMKTDSQAFEKRSALAKQETANDFELVMP
jgi:hypothetical protein